MLRGWWTLLPLFYPNKQLTVKIRSMIASGEVITNDEASLHLAKGVSLSDLWYLLTKVENRMTALSTTIAEMTAVMKGWKKETQG